MNIGSSEPRTPAHSRSLRSPACSAPPRILLADDDGLIRNLSATALRDCGYEVLEADDGGRLLVQIASTYSRKGRDAACDLLVTDIHMPVCSGIEIVEALRMAHWTIPVIFITALGSSSIHAHAKTLDAIVLDKPFDLKELQSTVRRLLPPEASRVRDHRVT